MSSIGVNEQTPREIVTELDKYIVGQQEAKRAVAIALRNRWRSRQLDTDMREDIIPKNILMIGSTGVGKTEIARRLARLVRAPFLKVEATKFTEVGYVGRDVESIVRDLVETAVRMVRREKLEEVKEKAAENAEERLIDVFVPTPKKSVNPLGKLFGAEEEPAEEKQEPPKYQAGRDWVRKRLHAGELEDEMIEIDVEESSRPMAGMFAGSSLEGVGDNVQSKRRINLSIWMSLQTRRYMPRNTAVSCFLMRSIRSPSATDTVRVRTYRARVCSGIFFRSWRDRPLLRSTVLSRRIISSLSPRERSILQSRPISFLSCRGVFRFASS